jgi:hypothetical protein
MRLLHPFQRKKKCALPTLFSAKNNARFLPFSALKFKKCALSARFSAKKKMRASNFSALSLKVMHALCPFQR